jgi:hypothetical protein
METAVIGQRFDLGTSRIQTVSLAETPTLLGETVVVCCIPGTHNALQSLRKMTYGF